MDEENETATRELGETFTIVCKACRSSDIRVIKHEGLYETDIMLKCNNCGEFVTVNNEYTGDL